MQGGISAMSTASLLPTNGGKTHTAPRTWGPTSPTPRPAAGQQTTDIQKRKEQLQNWELLLKAPLRATG